MRAVWAPNTFNVETASLPAGGVFGPTTVLCSTRNCRDVHASVSANGGAYVTWDFNNGEIMAASGSVLGNLAAPVVAANAGRICGGNPGCFIPHGTLTDSGQGALTWFNRGGNGCNIRNPDGTWPLQFFPGFPPSSTNPTPTGTSANCAIDSAGNAITIFKIATTSNSTPHQVMFVRPAGGNFGAPTALPELDTANGFTLISDSAGTIILVWADASGNIMARQNLPGGGLGPSTIVGPGSSLGLATIVPDPATGGGLALVQVTGGISHMQVP